LKTNKGKGPARKKPRVEDAPSPAPAAAEEAPAGEAPAGEAPEDAPADEESSQFKLTENGFAAKSEAFKLRRKVWMVLVVQ